MRDLLSVFGVSMTNDSTFIHDGKTYKINFGAKQIKIKTNRQREPRESLKNISQSPNFNSFFAQMTSQNNNYQPDQGQFRQSHTHTEGGAEKRAKTPMNGTQPMGTNSQTGTSAAKSQSHRNLCPPTAKSKGQLTIPAPKQQNLLANLKTQKSGGAESFSARRSDYSRKSQKSEIVSNHENMAERQRRKQRQKSLNKNVNLRDQNRNLQIERQNQTDQRNQGQMTHLGSFENINLSARQLTNIQNMGQSKHSEKTLSVSGNIKSLQIDSYQTTQNHYPTQLSLENN